MGQASWQKVFQVWASLGSIVASVIRPVPGEAAPAEAQPCAGLGREYTRTVLAFYLSHRARQTGYTPRGFRCKQRSLLRVRSGARTQRRRIPPGYSNPPRQWGPVHGSCSAHALRFRFVSRWSPRKAQRAGLFPARPRDATIAGTSAAVPFGRGHSPLSASQPHPLRPALLSEQPRLGFTRGSSAADAEPGLRGRLSIAGTDGA